jgi:hypothetical protein
LRGHFLAVGIFTLGEDRHDLVPPLEALLQIDRLQRAFLDHVVLEEVFGVGNVDRVGLREQTREQRVVRRSLHFHLEAQILACLLGDVDEWRSKSRPRAPA